MSRSASAFCITHTSASEHLTRLPPFALGTVFPSSDYYGGSVALRLSPVRRSRVPCVADDQVAVGALFVFLRSLETIPLPQACRRRMTFTSGGAITAVSRCSRAVNFTGWTLGFKQFSLHRGNRASTGVGPSGFVPPCLPSHAAFPLGFRRGGCDPSEVGLVAQESHAPLLPCYTGIKRRRDTAHRPRSASGSRGRKRCAAQDVNRVASLPQLLVQPWSLPASVLIVTSAAAGSAFHRASPSRNVLTCFPV